MLLVISACGERGAIFTGQVFIKKFKELMVTIDRID